METGHFSFLAINVITEDNLLGAGNNAETAQKTDSLMHALICETHMTAALAHARTHTHAHAYINTQTQTNTHTHTHTHTRARARAHEEQLLSPLNHFNENNTSLPTEKKGEGEGQKGKM